MEIEKNRMVAFLPTDNLPRCPKCGEVHYMRIGCRDLSFVIKCKCHGISSFIFPIYRNEDFTGTVRRHKDALEKEWFDTCSKELSNKYRAWMGGKINDING